MLLLLSLAFSSVFGIVENRSVGFPDFLPNQHFSNRSCHQPPSRLVFHETHTDKEEIVLEENEDGKEEVSDEAFPILIGESQQYFNQCDYSNALINPKPISLNILYCVFRI